MILTMMIGIGKQIDFTHTAGTDLLDDPVVGDHGAAGERYVHPGLVVVKVHTFPSTSDSAVTFARDRTGDRGEA